MKLKEVKKLRKIVLSSLIASVVVASGAPSAHIGKEAMAVETETTQDTNSDEATSDPNTETTVTTGTGNTNENSQSSQTTPTESTTENQDSESSSTESGQDQSKDISESGNVEGQEQTAGQDQTQTQDPAEGDETTTESEGSDQTDDQGTVETPDTPAQTEDAEPQATDEDSAEAVPKEETKPEETQQAAPTAAQEKSDVVKKHSSESDTVVKIKQSSDSGSSNSNAQAIRQGITVASPVITNGLRFWTIAMNDVKALEDLSILEEQDPGARVIGTLPKDGTCYILKDVDDEWLYVESGSVRGFVQKNLVAKEEAPAEDITDVSEEITADTVDAEEAAVEDITINAEPDAGQAEDASAVLDITTNMNVMDDISKVIEDIVVEDPVLATEVVPASENAAFDYYKATVYQTVVEKDFALPANGELNIMESQDENSRVVGTLPESGLCYVIADKNKDWVYVESGDVRGFVKHDDLILTDEAGNVSQTWTDDPVEKASDASDFVQAGIFDLTTVIATNVAPDSKEANPITKDNILSQDESDYAQATATVVPKKNNAVHYTMTSVKSGIPNGMLRNSLLEYASQFIGNPYVWGGTSLTNGADCSGFAQQIYAQYGYSLPRTAAEQSQVGTKIAVEDALPGDLIFYSNGDRVYHVVIYAGDGKTIEAKSTKYGIVQSTVNEKAAAWAVRLIDETTAVQYDVPEGLGSIHTYMGWQMITNTRSQQYAFREAAGMTFDSEGFAIVDNRYVIACTTTFGAIGDYVDFYQEDGTVIPCIIGDFKSQSYTSFDHNPANEWGHLDGKCMVEFVVDKDTWYNGHANPGTASCHPEWNQNIVKVIRTGSFYD